MKSFSVSIESSDTGDHLQAISNHMERIILIEFWIADHTTAIKTNSKVDFKAAICQGKDAYWQSRDEKFRTCFIFSNPNHATLFKLAKGGYEI